MSGEWTRLREQVDFAAGQLRRFAAELTAPIDDGHQDQVAEQTVFLAADLACAASNALNARYPWKGRQ